MSQDSQSNEFQLLLHLASTILQDFVSIAGNLNSGNVKLRITSENLTAKMIHMIAALSETSISLSNCSKRYQKQEKRASRYIDRLRDCLIMQNQEIQRLESELVHFAKERKLETTSVATNTDAADNKNDTIIRDYEASMNELRKKLHESQVSYHNLSQEHTRIKKELSKANMMLKTQQIILEDESFLANKFSKSPSPKLTRTTDGLESKEKSGRIEDSTMKLKVKLPLDKFHIGRYNDSTVRFSIEPLEQQLQEEDKAAASKESSSDSSKKNIDSVSPPYIKEYVSLGVDIVQNKLSSNTGRDIMVHNESQDEQIDSLDGDEDDLALKENYSFENTADISLSTESQDYQEHSMSTSFLQDSEDSFALITDYYDDYFRINNPTTSNRKGEEEDDN